MIRTLALCGVLLSALALPLAAREEGKKDNGKAEAAAFNTPQECFDAIAAAEVKKDYKAYFSCFAPQTLRMMAGEVAVKFIVWRIEYKWQKDEEAQEKPKAWDKEEQEIWETLDKESQERWKAMEKRYKELQERMNATNKRMIDVLDKHGLTEDRAKDINPSDDHKERRKAEKVASGLIKDPASFLTDAAPVLFAPLKGLGFGGGSEVSGSTPPKRKLFALKIDGDKATGTTAPPGGVGEKVLFVKIGKSWKILEVQDAWGWEDKD